MALIDKETIRAEILRYRNKSAEELGVGFLESDKAKTFTNGGVAWVCERLLAFLDTLPEQLENFNAAFDKYMKEHWTHGTQIKEVALHFYELGLNSKK